MTFLKHLITPLKSLPNNHTRQGICTSFLLEDKELLSRNSIAVQHLMQGLNEQEQQVQAPRWAYDVRVMPRYATPTCQEDSGSRHPGRRMTE